MTKKVVSYFRKIGVTPAVAAPGDINPSDATGRMKAKALTSSSSSGGASLTGHSCLHEFTATWNGPAHASTPS